MDYKISNMDGKIAENKLEEQKEITANLIRCSAVPTFVIDSDHTVLFWNKACEELTGMESSKIIGTKNHGQAFYNHERPCIADIIISGEFDKLTRYYAKYGKSTHISNGLHAEGWFSNLGGKERYIIFDAAPIYNNTGELIAVMETLQDIAKLKKAEEAIQKYAEKLKRSNELKDLFTDILRHDLLNPANIIRGFTEVLLDTEEDEKKRNTLQIIKRNNEKLIDLIDTASKFAKLETVEELQFSVMDIGLIISELFENFKPHIDEKNMTINFRANRPYPSKVNPVIEEVFSNLLSNAIKYSPNESNIEIDILDERDDWKVTFTDFGEGISDEDKSKLFTRFKRVDKKGIKGTGLGLAIAKRIVDLHSGNVGIEDNPEGQGTVFWVTVKKA